MELTFFVAWTRSLAFILHPIPGLCTVPAAVGVGAFLSSAGVLHNDSMPIQVLEPKPQLPPPDGFENVVLNLLNALFTSCLQLGQFRFAHVRGIMSHIAGMFGNISSSRQM